MKVICPNSNTCEYLMREGGTMECEHFYPHEKSDTCKILCIHAKELSSECIPALREIRRWVELDNKEEKSYLR